VEIHAFDHLEDQAIQSREPTDPDRQCQSARKVDPGSASNIGSDSLSVQ
jgi:hypothetical protein